MTNSGTVSAVRANVVAYQESSELVLEAIADSMNDGLITQDVDGVITRWNRSAERLFGFTAGEMLGCSGLQLIPEELQLQEHRVFEQLWASEAVDAFETVRLTKDGRQVPVLMSLAPICNRAGFVVGMASVARDLTEQKLLAAAQGRLAAIVESADDAILSKDLNGTIQSWNAAATRIFGYRAEEMIGQSILKLIPPELHGEEAMILAKIRNGERVDHYESERLTKTGQRVQVSLTISALRNLSGTVVGASKIVREVTERNRMQARILQAEKLAASGRMAATIAHEINNPLEAVQNLIYLAKLDSHEPTVTSYLDMAESEIERLAHIARQTLGFYREQNLPQPTSLAGLVRDALRIYEGKLRASGIVVSTIFESMREVVVRRGEMMQVVSNLITNAMYAMPGGGALEFVVREARHDGCDGLRLTVKDTGVGIAEEHLQRVFEPFFTTRGTVGTGIGLWVVQRFVQGHEGTVEVVSQTEVDGHGTAFTIWLPFERTLTHENAA